MIKNNSILPYFRKDTSSTLLALSAIALLTISSLPLSNFLLQPAQAETTVTFQPSPTTVQNNQFTLTFEAKGTACSSYCHDGEVTSGTFQMNTSDGVYDNGLLYAHASSFTNDSSGVTVNLSYVGNKDAGGTSYLIVTSCSTSDSNDISVTTPETGNLYTDFYDPVECTIGGGDTTTAQSTQPSSSSPMTGTTTQSRDTDGDGDGIPDSSDRCDHNSHHRCFKEGDNNTTTTSTNQQPSSSSFSSSSSSSGNQTR